MNLGFPEKESQNLPIILSGFHSYADGLKYIESLASANQAAGYL